MNNELAKIFFGLLFLLMIVIISMVVGSENINILK
jgi:hypothetical protein